MLIFFLIVDLRYCAPLISPIAYTLGLAKVKQLIRLVATKYLFFNVETFCRFLLTNLLIGKMGSLTFCI